MTAQLNIEFLSNFPYESVGNDIWGYVAPDSSEYAIMGTFDGVSVVNVTDPRDPQEVVFIPQQGSTWRDIKTWGSHAYVTADEAGTTDGLLVIDLSDLPDTVSWRNTTDFFEGQAPVNTCHNIYIDEFGYAYLSGCDANNGGLLFVDVFTNPDTPRVVGLGAPEYSHDIYVRDNIAYSSEINIGVLGIYDVSDKDSVELLATQATPFEFTHNAWLSDDGLTVFTTDELGNAPVAAYDVSDLDDIKFLDAYRPTATLGDGVVPHNVHVWDDYLIISYYTDGCIVVDASRPDNLVEVGNFDTFFPDAVGFAGAWGAYPFLPSGNILIGDMNSGLVVLGPTYKRASFLEGVVKDSVTGIGIFNARVEMSGTTLLTFENSGVDGSYKTGTVDTGYFSATASVFGYEPKTIDSIELASEEVTLVDFELKRLPTVALELRVIDAATSMPLPGSKVMIETDGFSAEYEADAGGIVAIPDFTIGTYDLVVGQWGYEYQFINAQNFESSPSNQSLTIELFAGITDVFSLDLGWTTSLQGFSGEWERGNPIAVTSPDGQILLAPEDDSDDLGSQCFVTANTADFNAGFVFGTTILESPSFDLTSYERPALSYEHWYWASDFQGNPTTEEMVVVLDNGITSVVIDTIRNEFPSPNQWFDSGEILVSDHLEATTDMRIRFITSESGFDDAVEAGIDNFRVFESESTATLQLDESLAAQVLPNPSQDIFEILLDEALISDQLSWQLRDAQGQLIQESVVSEAMITFGEELPAGLYFFQLLSDEAHGPVQKLIKQ